MEPSSPTSCALGLEARFERRVAWVRSLPLAFIFVGLALIIPAIPQPPMLSGHWALVPLGFVALGIGVVSAFSEWSGEAPLFLPSSLLESTIWTLEGDRLETRVVRGTRDTRKESLCLRDLVAATLIPAQESFRDPARSTRSIVPEQLLLVFDPRLHAVPNRRLGPRRVALSLKPQYDGVLRKQLEAWACICRTIMDAFPDQLAQRWCEATASERYLLLVLQVELTLLRRHASRPRIILDALSLPLGIVRLGVRAAFRGFCLFLAAAPLLYVINKLGWLQSLEQPGYVENTLIGVLSLMSLVYLVYGMVKPFSNVLRDDEATQSLAATLIRAGARTTHLDSLSHFTRHDLERTSHEAAFANLITILVGAFSLMQSTPGWRAFGFGAIGVFVLIQLHFRARNLLLRRCDRTVIAARGLLDDARGDVGGTQG